MDGPDDVIDLKNVSKTFEIYHDRRTTLFEYVKSLFHGRANSEKIRVLDDVSFSVKRGEMLGIIGLNGSGKTTLLRIMAKIYSPDAGTITTRGKIMPFLGFGVGFNPELTAKDNIILYGSLLGFTKKEILKKMDPIVEYAGIEKFLDTKLKNFSSGMSARLAFSTAIQVDPDILIVDEALSVGDITFREKSFKTFMEFREKGKTIIYVSHDIHEIKDLCDRAIFLHRGKILASGSPPGVVETYLRTVNSA